MARPFPKFGYNPVTGEWNDSLTGEFLWSNVNLSEAVPDVMTPSTWSLWWIFHYETNPINFPGNYPFCGNVGGRPYFNLSLLFSVYQAVGQNPREEMQGDMLGYGSLEDIQIPTLPFSAFLVYRTVLPGTLKARWLMRRCQKELPRFLENTPGWCRVMRAEILRWNEPSRLREGWQSILKPAIAQACQMLRFATAGLARPSTRLRQELSNLVGSTDAAILLSNLSGPSGNLASLGPLLGLAQVAQGQLSRDAYLEQYGHRGPHEMELSIPGVEEVPDWLEKRLSEFTQTPENNVETLLSEQRARQAVAWNSFATRFPEKAPSIQKQLKTLAIVAQRRESVRSEVTRMARLLRTFLLQAGEVTGLGNDIFFLSLDEVAEVLAGDKTSLPNITPRRGAYQTYCSYPSYPAIILGQFTPSKWAVDPDRRSDFFDARQSLIPAISKKIKGFAGAAGCMVGNVRRIDCIEEGNQIKPGEILVTTITNIGWTPLFPRLAAIVTDVGAPLSHAAIVARELGIPAVVGCGNATMLLKTGDRVRVDGGNGIVEILES